MMNWSSIIKVLCVAVDFDNLFKFNIFFLKYPQLLINFFPFDIISKDNAPD